MKKFKMMCCNPKYIIVAALMLLAVVSLSPLKATLLPFLPLLFILYCPLMMFFMIRTMK